MAHQPGWYPPGQICYPPELPAYLSNVHNLQPVVGLPSDTEVIGIDAVIQAARKASEIPGMDDPNLIMKLGDHLFNVQMGGRLSRASQTSRTDLSQPGTEASIRSSRFRVFGQDATYTPPVLPAHVAIKLEPISGAPSDKEVMKVQGAIQAYQEFRRVPSMFNAHVNMELSQHLFDIQMARHMRLAGERPPCSALQTAAVAKSLAQVGGRTPNSVEEATPTNNAGTGANSDTIHPTPSLAHGSDTRELLERSNQLTERFNKLLERSNELMERCTPPEHSISQTLADRFNQVLDRLAQPLDHPLSNRLAERFNELAEQQSQSSLGANKLAEQLNQLTERSNQLAEKANVSWERMGSVLENINRVLVGVQHAIVRNHKGNKVTALDCLVNERGDTPAISEITATINFSWLRKNEGTHPTSRLPVVIDGASQDTYVPDHWLGEMLRFYDIADGLCERAPSIDLMEGMEHAARERLGRYLSSCLG